MFTEVIDIKNSQKALQKYVFLKYDLFTYEIFRVLYREGYISHLTFFINIRGQKVMKIRLKYSSQGKTSFNKVFFLSKPGKPLFLDYPSVAKFSTGLGTLFLATNKGVLAHQDCITKKIGGKCLFYLI